MGKPGLVIVEWDDGLTDSGKWGALGEYQFDLIDESPDAPTPAPKPYSDEARLFFGTPASTPHPLLAAADKRRKA